MFSISSLFRHKNRFLYRKILLLYQFYYTLGLVKKLKQELYLKKAKEEAEEILSNADKESSRLISESFVLQEAVVEANALVKQAEQEAILSRASVEDKLDNKLEEIKSKIDELSDIVEREKTNLRQPRKITEPVYDELIKEIWKWKHGKVKE